MPTKKQLEAKISMLNDALEMSLAVSPERDNNFFTGGMSDLYSGRSNWDRKKIFSESMRAWRVNPMARRIVRLMTSFVIGKGLAIKSDDTEVQTFLTEWWKKNKFQRNLKRWKDEDTRTGNLFVLFNVLENGMSILRAIPAEQIEEIVTAEGDAETETRYDKDETGEEFYPAYNAEEQQKTFMMHFASNQPIGSPWGEADLSPLLVWIGRFSSWLEDRVRLNRFRTAFMYVIRGSYASEAERSTREKQLRANPPQSGSLLVLNANAGEDWGILSANLDAFDASMDGMAIKKMFSGGIGFPLHWLAEGESSTQSTAEAAGTPTFRTLEETQNDFFEMVIELAQTAVTIKFGQKSNAAIWVEGPDITERDNATLALALGRAYPHLADLLDRDGIEDKEFMRLVYKMFAEVWGGKERKINKKPLIKPDTQPAAVPDDSKTDPSDPQDE
jgi:hypothetical protein